MKDFLDVHSPAFAPVWRRVAMTVAVCGWAAFEAVAGSPFFAVIFGAAGAWLIHQFFIAWDPSRFEDDAEG